MGMELIALGEWNGVKIRCNPADQGYVNATDMARACGKLWADYWRTKETQEFIHELSGSMGIPIDRLVISVRTGPNEARGTWIHRKVAYNYAQDLLPAFAVWIVDRIEELLMRGHTELEPRRDNRAIVLLQDTLYEVRAQREENRQTIDLCFQTLRQLQHAPIHRVEAEVERQLAAEIGGVRQVYIKNGMWKVDLLTDKYAIEIKHWKDWKDAVGQLKTVSKYLDQDLRIHLFWRPLEKPPAQRRRAVIEHELKCQGIELTWHDWKLPSGDFQPLLPNIDP